MTSMLDNKVGIHHQGGYKNAWRESEKMDKIKLKHASSVFPI